jgi:nucleoside-diphosphate-sugar epimerase
VPRLFCLGFGYSASALTRRLAAKGWSIAGTARTAESAESLRAQGIEACPVPPVDPDRDLAGASHVLVSIPPDESGDPGFGLYGAAIARMPGLAWLGYLSTTGVYGDRQGGWVDEDSALEPTGERGRRRVAAERAWLDLYDRHDVPVHVFRLAGIYGPGRSALNTVKSGRAQRVVKPGQVFSRIHVEDIASVLAASIARPRPGAVYNVCDDDPAPPDVVIAHACQLLGVAPPPPVPFEEAELSAMARSFYADSKRVSNRRIKDELGVRLAYPGYRDGLAALAAGTTP